jgi:hypothetical protein
MLSNVLQAEAAIAVSRGATTRNSRIRYRISWRNSIGGDLLLIPLRHHLHTNNPKSRMSDLCVCVCVVSCSTIAAFVLIASLQREFFDSASCSTTWKATSRNEKVGGRNKRKKKKSGLSL